MNVVVPAVVRVLKKTPDETSVCGDEFLHQSLWWRLTGF